MGASREIKHALLDSTLVKWDKASGDKEHPLNPSGWRELLADAARDLAQADVASPRNDAEWIAVAASGVPRSRLIIADEPDLVVRERFAAMVARRAQREPLQHIVGTAPFWRRELAVGPGVFVPRPETELLVEWALRELVDRNDPVVVDLCAGSGAIGTAVVTERADAVVYAVEADETAATWLRRNLRDGTVVVADATAPTTLSHLDGAVDLVVSNPPYVPTGVEVPAEVHADPPMAVFGGGDGMDVIRPLVTRIATLLAPGGVTAIEHDDTHGETVPQLLREAGFEDVAAHRDLAGRPRFATGRRRR